MRLRGGASEPEALAHAPLRAEGARDPRSRPPATAAPAGAPRPSGYVLKKLSQTPFHPFCYVFDSGAYRDNGKIVLQLPATGKFEHAGIDAID